MPRSTYRVLKRRGQVTLVEGANPVLGADYAVWAGGVRLWHGTDRLEAESRFRYEWEARLG